MEIRRGCRGLERPLQRWRRRRFPAAEAAATESLPGGCSSTAIIFGCCGRGKGCWPLWTAFAPSWLLAYLAASAAGLFNRMLALRVENALHLNGFVNTVNGYQALATVIASAAMFLLFQNIHIRSDYWRRWVFRLAPLSFGVYLLHDSDFTRALLWRLVDLPRFGGALLPSLAYLTGAVLLIAVAGYAVDAVYQRLYRLLRLPALETKLDALTACILQRIVGSEKA